MLPSMSAEDTFRSYGDVCPLANRWETMQLAGLIFRWDNSEAESLTLYSGVEKPLNIVFVSHHHHQIVPSVFGDIPAARIVEVFRRRPGEVEAYQFDIQITCSNAVNGVSLKPVRACLELRVTNDPENPHLELKQVEEEK